MRQYHEQWLARSGGRTAFGLTGIPATRFRGVIRFLQAFAAGEEADMPERAADLPLPNFIRYCADDLKALYYEGRLAMKPAAGGDEVARWFWGETASGQLLRRVKDLAGERWVCRCINCSAASSASACPWRTASG